EETKLAPDRISSSDRLESFGIDSVMIHRINHHLEKDLGPLPKTMLYEQETIGELAKFLLHETPGALITLFGTADSVSEAAVPSVSTKEITFQDEEVNTRENHHIGRVAIIGVHGYYPHSKNLDEYWQNLKQGRDLIDL